jgi:hypothetical protein
VDLLLDLLTAVGVGVAVGVRPFLATLVVAALALADLGTDFDGTALEVLESPVVLVAAALGAGVALARKVPAQVLLGLSVVLGALLAGAIVDDRHDAWAYALPIGAAAAALAGVAAGQVFARVQQRLAKTGDDGLLPAYGEAIALVVAALSVLVPFFGLLALGGVAWLALQQRKRQGEKYAGLRILR